jgi:hypothetical protein
VGSMVTTSAEKNFRARTSTPTDSNATGLRRRDDGGSFPAHLPRGGTFAYQLTSSIRTARPAVDGRERLSAIREPSACSRSLIASLAGFVDEVLKRDALMLDQSLHRRTPKRALGPKMPSPDPDLRLEPLRLVGPPQPLQWTSCCTSQDRTKDNARHDARLSHISQGGS